MWYTCSELSNTTEARETMRRKLVLCSNCLKPIYYYPGTAMGSANIWCANCSHQRDPMDAEDLYKLRVIQYGPYHKKRNLPFPKMESTPPSIVVRTIIDDCRYWHLQRVRYGYRNTRKRIRVLLTHGVQVAHQYF